MSGIFSGEFEIFTYPFNRDTIYVLEAEKWAKELQPLVYLLSDETLKEAYVGESTNIIARLYAHLLNPDRLKLADLHLITSDKFNKSATLDIESNLIKYIAGDGKYKPLNGNAGLVHHSYYQRDEYLKLLVDILNVLKEKEIISKPIQEIENSDLFKYSPYKALTSEQFVAAEAIINNITVKDQSLAFVNGGAGTGKTILAIYLAKLFKTDPETIADIPDTPADDPWLQSIKALKNKFKDPKIALVVPMTSLRNTLKNVFKQVRGLNAGMVIGPSEALKQDYDILLVDEAHRLRRRVGLTNYGSFDKNNEEFDELDADSTELDWISLRSKHRILFYDPEQSIKPSDVLEDDFRKLFADSLQISLKSQLRVRGGEKYVEFIDKLLKAQPIPASNTNAKGNYDLFLFESLEELHTKLKEKEDEFGLCRLMAGYAWEWKSKKNKDLFDIQIEGVSLKWNSEAKEWINSPNAAVEVGCIHTTQGYDLNYAGIIFGDDISYDDVNNEIIVRPQNYHDRKGKVKIASPEDLKPYIVNIYKTLMYRGIRGTYVYATDKKLREYFKKHIPIFEETYSPKTVPLNEVKRYVNSVPFYDLSAAAGNFSPPQNISDCEWVELPPGFAYKDNYFICKVIGESMNKRIPNGSWCLFKRDPGGTRNGEIVLVEHRKIQDDIGSGYTVKEYHSIKKLKDGREIKEKIILRPKSTDPKFSDLILTPDDDLTELKVSGIFVDVLN